MISEAAGLAGEAFSRRPGPSDRTTNPGYPIVYETKASCES